MPDSVNPIIGQRLAMLFDAVFIINLKTRSDRRSEIQAQLGLIGLDLERAPLRLFEAVRPESSGEWPSIGACGCFMSHLGILRTAKAEDLGRILILEDDVDWSPSFLGHADRCLAALEDTAWDFVHGGLDEHQDTASPACLPLEPTNGLRLTHFIALSCKASRCAEAYLSAMAERKGGDSEGGPMHVDGAYSWFRKDNPDIQSFMFTPAIARQRASRTDIHELSWLDRAPVISSLVAQTRRMRNRLRAFKG
ncbi:MAG: glycosyltransferase family 25 protein [Paracoccaceae bacterium]